MAATTVNPKLEVYTTTLAGRLLTLLDAKRNTPFTGRLNGKGKRFSLSRLAIDSGIPYDSLANYVIRRNRPMPLTIVDSILYGLGLSVLDLLEPHELASAYERFNNQTRYAIRRLANDGNPLTTQPLSTSPSEPK